MRYTLRTVVFKTVSRKMIEVQKVQWLTRILKFPKKCQSCVKSITPFSKISNFALGTTSGSSFDSFLTSSVRLRLQFCFRLSSSAWVGSTIQSNGDQRKRQYRPQVSESPHPLHHPRIRFPFLRQRCVVSFPILEFEVVTVKVLPPAFASVQRTLVPRGNLCAPSPFRLDFMLHFRKKRASRSVLEAECYRWPGVVFVEWFDDKRGRRSFQHYRLFRGPVVTEC